MPALIVFGSSTTEESKGRAESVRVAEGAEEVVERLGSAQSGFAALKVQSNDKRIWVNRDLVRMVRELGADGARN